MDIPLIAMIVHSGWAARIVLLILLVLSLVTWAIVFNRISFLKEAGRGNKLFKARFDKITAITELEGTAKGPLSPLAHLGAIGAAEYRRILADAKMQPGTKDWSFFLQNQFAMAAEQIGSAFGVIVSSFDKGVYLLAMVSSIAPFLGLLGTVWGIMNSFFEIGTQGSASLPVVAPGIAEALVVTLAGLAVAIPALFFYNYFNHRVEQIENELDQFKDVMVVRLKREITETIYACGRGNL